MRLRLRLPSGNKVVEVEPTDTLGSLFATAATLSGGDAATLQLLTGYPPTLINQDRSNTIEEAGITKGATCIVKLPAGAAAAAAAGPSSTAAAAVGMRDAGSGAGSKAPTASPTTAAAASSTGTGACPACTYINPSTATSCAMCTGPLAGAGAGGGGGSGGGGGGGRVEFELKKMPDDNSCLFHAIAFLCAPGMHASQLRGKIVDAVKANPDRWNAATLGKSVAEYCAFIINPIRWGTSALHADRSTEGAPQGCCSFFVLTYTQY